MLSFIVSRALQMIPVLFGVTVVTFALTQIIPGDLVDVMLGSTASEEARQELRHALGLDQPVIIQYFSYMAHLLSGDLGRSHLFSMPVASVLGDRLVNTAILAVSATVVAACGAAIGWLVAASDRLRSPAWADAETRTMAATRMILRMWNLPVFASQDFSGTPPDLV